MWAGLAQAGADGALKKVGSQGAGRSAPPFSGFLSSPLSLRPSCFSFTVYMLGQFF